ncbi:MAG: hypothetical protein ACON5F_02275 [Jejuia sp.]
MANDRITRKDIIDDDVLNLGKDYQISLQKAVDANEEWLASFAPIKKAIFETADFEKRFKNGNGRREFLQIKADEVEFQKRLNKSLDEQREILKNKLKIDEEHEKLIKRLLNTTSKRQVANTQTNKLLIEERDNLRLTNLEIKRNLTFMGRLRNERDKALKSIQEYQAKQKLGLELTKDEAKAFRSSQKEFRKYDEAIKSIRQSTNQFQENIGNYPKTIGIALSSFKKLIPIVGAGFGLREAFNFTKKARQFAIEAKGVEFAFDRIGASGQRAFENIQTSTRGLLSDLDIKKALVDFDNFNISLDQTDVLMEFLAVRSAQTGQSIEKLQSSLNEGLSKESKLRIDNLGISAKDLNEELERTPNFVEAVANIAKKEVAEAGSILEDAANAQQEWNAAYQNFQLQLGKGLVARASDSIYEFGTNLLRAITPAKELNNAIKQEQIELNTLVSSILKTNENEEDRKILIEELTEKYPFFLKFVDDENLANESLKKGLAEVNKLYINRLAITRLQEKLDLQSRQGRLADETADLAKTTADYQKALTSVNLFVNRNKLDNELASQSLERQNEVLKETINAEIVRLSQLRGQGEATDVQIRNLAKYEKALGQLAEAARIFSSARSQFGFAENAVASAEKEIKELEGLLGITSKELNELFDDESNAVLINVKLDPEAKEKALKQFLDDRANLDRQRIQANIDAETDISNNEVLNLGTRLNANVQAYRERIKLLNLNKELAIKAAKGREFEILRIEEAFNNEIINLNKERETQINAILEIEFQKRLSNLEREKDAFNDALNERISQEQEAFNENIKNLNGEARLQQIQDFEDRITQIRQNAAVERIKNEINALSVELNDPNLNPEQRIALENMVKEAKINLSNQVTENSISNARKQAAVEKELFDLKTDFIKNASNNIASALQLDAGSIEILLTSFFSKADETGNAIIDKYNKVAMTISQIGAVANIAGDIMQSTFSANIERIDEEIARNDEKYNRLLENELLSDQQRKKLEAKQKLDREALEKKKRKEKQKQAIAEKASAAVNVAIQTALGVISALAQVPKFDFGISASALAASIGAIGAVQLAAVLAQPIPKYAQGTENHPGGWALVGEGLENRKYVPEWVKEPNKKPYLVDRPTLLDLPKRSKVIPTNSLEDYDDMMRASILASVHINNQRLKEHESKVAVYNNYDDLVDKMSSIENILKKQKQPNVHLHEREIDINDALWAAQNKRIYND